MSSVSQEEEFTKVHRKRKKRKALGSPTYASNPAGD